MINRFLMSSYLKILILLFFCCTFFTGKAPVTVHLSKKKFNISGNAISLKNNNHSRDKDKKIFPIENSQKGIYFNKLTSTKKDLNQFNKFALLIYNSFLFKFLIFRKNHLNISFINISFLKELRTIRMLC